MIKWIKTSEKLPIPYKMMIGRYMGIITKQKYGIITQIVMFMVDIGDNRFPSDGVEGARWRYLTIEKIYKQMKSPDYWTYVEDWEEIDLENKNILSITNIDNNMKPVSRFQLMEID